MSFDFQNFVDITAPVIELIGEASVNVALGGSYNEEGATAEDDVDGDISSLISTGGDTVDTDVEGTYIITYNVADSSGNAAEEVTRTVNVRGILFWNGKFFFECFL